VEQVIHVVVQRVATVAPEAPVLEELPALARDAHTVAATMLFLDGGRSFRQLTDGCIQVVDRASALVQEEWNAAGSAGSTSATA